MTTDNVKAKKPTPATIRISQVYEKQVLALTDHKFLFTCFSLYITHLHFCLHCA